MTEVVTIKLGDRRPIGHIDELGRSHIGWEEGLSQKEVWLTGRAYWKMNPSRAIACDLVYVVNHDLKVVAVAKLTGIMKGNSHGDRLEIVGDLLEDHEDLGKTVSRNNRSMNPVSYIEETQLFG